MRNCFMVYGNKTERKLLSDDVNVVGVLEGWNNSIRFWSKMHDIFKACWSNFRFKLAKIIIWLITDENVSHFEKKNDSLKMQRCNRSISGACNKFCLFLIQRQIFACILLNNEFFYCYLRTKYSKWRWPIKNCGCVYASIDLFFFAENNKDRTIWRIFTISTITKCWWRFFSRHFGFLPSLLGLKNLSRSHINHLANVQSPITNLANVACVTKSNATTMSDM